MPQMSPLWWEYLFIMFTILFLSLMTNMYYSYNIKINNNNKMLVVPALMWKW